jgi:hypothetical protein
MKPLSIICIYYISMLACTGCVSSSIDDSVAIIAREANKENNRTVNSSVMASIQALRSTQTISSQKKLLTSTTSENIASESIINQSHNFAYQLHNKELNYGDKLKIARLLEKKNTAVIINVAPAKGTNKLDQLSLSMERAEMLRMYISHFNKEVTIKFSPKLSTDTINLVTGA